MDEVAVLVLNYSYEPLHFCNARKAILMVLSGKAESVEESQRVIRSPSLTLRIPLVIRLIFIIRRPQFKSITLNKKNILKRDNYTCQYCGKRGDGLTIDHVIPRSRGGLTTWNNVVTACIKCNLKKGDRTLGEAQMSLIRQPSRPHFFFSFIFARSSNLNPHIEAWKKYIPSIVS